MSRSAIDSVIIHLTACQVIAEKRHIGHRVHLAINFALGEALKGRTKRNEEQQKIHKKAEEMANRTLRIKQETLP